MCLGSATWTGENGFSGKCFQRVAIGGILLFGNNQISKITVLRCCSDHSAQIDSEKRCTDIAKNSINASLKDYKIAKLQVSADGH